MAPNPELADYLDGVATSLSQMAGGIRSGKLSIDPETPRGMALINICFEVVGKVGNPRYSLMPWLRQFAHFTAIRLFIKWKAFGQISNTGTSYAELAGRLGVDVSLISETLLSFASFADGSSPCTQLASAASSWQTAPSN